VVAAGLTALEALGIAIRREMDAGGPTRSRCRLRQPPRRDRFPCSKREAQQHETMLRGHYAPSFPDVKLAVPPGGCCGAGGGDGGTVRSEGALASPWRRSGGRASFYMERRVARRTRPGMSMLRYLADVHGRHQMMLESEYDTVLRYRTRNDDPQAPWRPGTPEQARK